MPPSFLAAIVLLAITSTPLAALTAPTTAHSRQPASAPAQHLDTVAGIPISPELKGQRVEEVRILGNSTVSTAIIRNLIRTREGDKFDPATVEEDYQRIFALKKFSNVIARVEPTSTGVIVIFQVTEQKQIKALRFTGNVHIETKTLERTSGLQAGEAIDSFRIALARQAIVKLYRDKGYPYAHVAMSMESLSKTGILHMTIVEGPHVRVRRIKFEGNKSFSAWKLKDEIKTRSWIWILQAGIYDPDQIEDDVASLRQYYQQHGFFDARVGRTVIVSPDQSEVMVTFVIDEGPRYIVDKITFRGMSTDHNAHVTEAKIRAVLKMTPGTPYDIDTLRRDVRAIVKVYSPDGFIYLPQSDNPDYLRIDPKYIFRKEVGKVEIIYNIRQGKPFYNGRIIIKGNRKVQDKVWLRELHVVPGQLYNSAELQDAADRIRATQLVSNVTITPVGDDPNIRDILVDLDESQTARFQVGAGFTSNAGVLGQISYEQRNFDITNIPSNWNELFSSHAFTGAGQYLRITLEPGTEQSRARIQFQEPYLFDQPYTFGTDAYYTTIEREEWEEARTGAKLSLGKRFTTDTVGRITLRGEDVDVYGLQDLPRRALEIIDLQGHTTITSVALDLRRDTTDSPILPSKGSSIGVSWEAVGALGGQYTFNKFTADAAFHQALNDDLLDRKTTLTEKVTAGYIDSFAPFFERFYGGGIGSLRGFAYRGVSPREGPDDDPVGGNWSFVGTVELNFPLIGDSVRGVVFTDVGDVEPTLSVGTIRVSVGAGVRLQLPIFGQIPLALDFAIPLAQDRLDRRQVISFSLGVSQ